jgi:hypothetical protein
MDFQLSRREMLRFMMVVLPTTLFGYQKADYFDEELVCVHVFSPSQDLPSPLLKSNGEISKRTEVKKYFQIGLPELLLCETKIALLDIFQYFWPVSRQEITRFHTEIEIRQMIIKVQGIEDLKSFEKKLDTPHKDQFRKAASLSVILTLNDYTRHICKHLVGICKRYNIDELVIFKDPSKPPYLCRYPSRQKGFKKPPPIGGNLKPRVFT